MFEGLTISPENIRIFQQVFKQLQVQNGAMRDALAKARAAGKTVFLSRKHIRIDCPHWQAKESKEYALNLKVQLPRNSR